MSCSAAKMEANRLNALKSTGPRTPEGREAARGNALKHGLTGAGVVIPGEDRAEVEARVEAFQAELAPGGGAVGRSLAAQAAWLMVRSERCRRHEGAVTADRVREAEAAFDRARVGVAEELFGDVAGNRRELLAMPEGVDLILGALAELRARAGSGWSGEEAERFEACTGQRITPDGAQVGGVVGRIDGEMARLRGLRAGLDLAAIEQGRAAAGRRALIGTDADSVLVRKYEAATQRALFRTLKEIREHRQPRDQPTAAQITATMIAHARGLDEDELDDPLASFFPLDLPEAPPSLGTPVPAGWGRNRPFADGRPGKNRPRLPK